MSKIENEKKEVNSYSFTPKLSKASIKLCESNELFKIVSIYERNQKWKENANKILKIQHV